MGARRVVAPPVRRVDPVTGPAHRPGTPPPQPPRPGDVLRVGRAASVQFDGDRAVVFRVISVDCVDAYTGWAWLTGYVLGRSGVAVDRREIFVHLAGLRRPRPESGPRVPPPRRPAVPAPPAGQPRKRSPTLATLRVDSTGRHP